MANPSDVSLSTVLNYIKSTIGEIANWFRIFAGLAISIIMLAVTCTMLGYPIPYIATKGSLYEIAAIIAAIGYTLAPKK